MRVCLGLILAGIAFLYSVPCFAQEIHITGPLMGSAPISSPPTESLVSWWAGASGSIVLPKGRSTYEQGQIVIGTKGSVPLFRVSATRTLMAGTWAQFSMDSIGARGEGGVHFAADLSHGRPRTTTELRFGIGDGKDLLGDVTNATLVFAVGRRWSSAPHRCALCENSPEDYMGSLAAIRAVVSARATFEDSPKLSLTLGVELETGFLLGD